MIKNSFESKYLLNIQNICLEIFNWISHHDQTDSALPHGPDVAGGGGDAEEEGEAEQGGAQASQQAGAEVERDGLLGGEGDIQPGLGQQVEQEVQAVGGDRHQQHRHQQREERQHLQGRV